MAVVAQVDVAGRANVSTGRHFYVGIAVACLAVAVIGFAPTYWLPLLRGTLDVRPIFHVHAAVFYGWTLLFMTQAYLVANRRITRHREWGVFGVALATTMCFVGMAAALTSLKQSTAAGFGEAARPFVIIPVSGIVFFAALFTFALLKVKHTETHKRIMLVATVSLLQAAVGRWFLILLAPASVGSGPAAPPPVAISVMPGLVSDLLIVAAMAHDRKTIGRVHTAYWAAGGALVALQLLRVPLSTTDAWARIAAWLSTLSL